jgi:hypothetical protein
MRLTRILLVAALALALVPAAAVASARLSLRTGDKWADRTASNISDDWQGDDGTSIDDYDLSDCTRVSRAKADCAVTYYLDDGSDCDDTIHVKLNRKGRPVTSSDSDAGDTQTFQNCTDPTDDPSADDGSGDDPGVDDGSGDF